MGISSNFILQNWDVDNKQDWGNKIRSKTGIPLKTMLLHGSMVECSGRVHPDENVTMDWFLARIYRKPSFLSLSIRCAVPKFTKTSPSS